MTELAKRVKETITPFQPDTYNKGHDKPLHKFTTNLYEDIDDSLVDPYLEFETYHLTDITDTLTTLTEILDKDTQDHSYWKQLIQELKAILEEEEKKEKEQHGKL